MDGFFSLIQYCPDPSRAETANVGLVLLSPSHRYLSARATRNLDRIGQFFGLSGRELENLQRAEESMITRIQHSHEALLSPEALSHFAKTRVNSLRMTPLTSIVVDDHKEAFDRLFSKFVGQ